jgi:hypothetical protein
MTGRAVPFGKSRISAGAPKQPVSSSCVNARCSGILRLRPAASGTSARTSAMKPFMSAEPRP